MTAKEFKSAVEIAKSDVEITEPIEIMDGYGLDDFVPVFVTLRQVARLIRWQAGQFDGEWNSEELQSIQRLGRKRFQIVKIKIDFQPGKCETVIVRRENSNERNNGHVCGRQSQNEKATEGMGGGRAASGSVSAGGVVSLAD